MVCSIITIISPILNSCPWHIVHTALPSWSSRLSFIKNRITHVQCTTNNLLISWEFTVHVIWFGFTSETLIWLILQISTTSFGTIVVLGDPRFRISFIFLVEDPRFQLMNHLWKRESERIEIHVVVVLLFMSGIILWSQFSQKTIKSCGINFKKFPRTSWAIVFQDPFASMERGFRWYCKRQLGHKSAAMVERIGKLMAVLFHHVRRATLLSSTLSMYLG